MARAVHLACFDDIAVLARLNRPVQQLHAQLYPRLFKSAPDEADVSRFFAATIAAPLNEIGICVEDGKALGYIWSERQQRVETPFIVATARLYIHHICVIEDSRRKGVASGLLAWAIQRAREEGVEALVLDHWAANEEAQAFFSRHGFESERVGMSKATSASA